MATPWDNPTMTLRLGDVADEINSVRHRLNNRNPLDYSGDSTDLGDLEETWRKLGRVINTMRSRNELPRHDLDEFHA